VIVKIINKSNFHYVGIASIALLSLCVATNSSFAVSPSDIPIASKNNLGNWFTRFELKTHDNAVTDVAYSADGSTLIAGSWDKKISKWDMSSGKPSSLPSMTTDKQVSNVIVSPAAKTIAFQKLGGDVEVWDVKANSIRFKLEKYSVSALVFSSKASTIITGSDKQIAVLETHSGNCIKVIEGSFAGIHSLAISKDDTRIASGSGKILTGDDSYIRIWDYNSEKLLYTLKGHEGLVSSLSFSEDGSLLASASWDGTVRIWEVRSGKEKFVLEGHEDRVNSVAFMPNSSMLASGSDDGTIKFWDVKTGKCIETLEGHKDSITSLSFSPTGKYLASGSMDQTVRIWKQQE
jgi:WD40 repeat protein